MPASIAAVLSDSRHRLAEAGIADPAVDAELLLAHVLGVGRGEVQLASLRGEEIDSESAAQLEALLVRRCAREPLQHLTGTAPFRHLELAVGPGVFVPRPETELVAQLAIDALRLDASPEPLAIDLGTGSGAIALALATEVPHARVIAVEVSDEAIAWTRRNVASIAADNLTLLHTDLAEVPGEYDGTLSVVVSNPPYVPDDAIPRDPEVRLHDPSLALYGGPDGLDVIRVISRVARRLLRPGGTLVLEHGEWQAAPIRDLLTADGWLAASSFTDLTGRDRATTALAP